jgi:AbrB family looped-hinge helix DNA binding protein
MARAKEHRRSPRGRRENKARKHGMAVAAREVPSNRRAGREPASADAPASLTGGDVKEWSTKVTSGGRVVLPAEVRAALGLTDGTSVRIRLDDGQVVIVPVREILRKIQEKWRRLVPQDRSMVDEFIAERRAEAERE